MIALLSLAATPAVRATFDWTLRNPPSPLPATGFTAMARGPGAWWAGDETGTLWRSSNGVIWERSGTLDSQRIETLRQPRDRAFAFTGADTRRGGAFVSRNGADWEAFTAGGRIGAGRMLRDVAWFRGRYVGVGYDVSAQRAFVAVSTDGAEWEIRLTAHAVEPRRLAADDSRAIAIGVDLLGSPAALVSSDGDTWENRRISVSGFGSDLAPRDIAVGKGTFVVVGGRVPTIFVPGERASYIVSSRDGVTWTEQAAPSGLTMHRPLNAVVFSGERFLAVGGSEYAGLAASLSPAAFVSDDGQTWRGASIGLESARSTVELTAAATDGVMATVSGVDGLLLRLSRSAEWSRLDAGWRYTGFLPFAGGAFWLADQGSALRSGDGVVWRRQSFQPAGGIGSSDLALGVLRGIAFSGQAFVGVFSTGSGSPAGLRSADGATWTPVDFGAPYFNDIASSETLVVAVGDAGRIALSADHGLTWSQADSGTRLNQLRRVAYGGGRFVALSDRSAHASTDGRQWTMATLPAGSSVNAMVFFNGKFFRIGSSAIDGGTLASSSDGLAWTTGTIQIPGFEVSDSFSGLVLGPDGLYLSARLWSGERATRWLVATADGVRWKTVEQTEMIPVSYGNGVWLARGRDGLYTAEVLPAKGLSNLSTLSRIDAQTLITGFVIGGTTGRSVLLRSTGPGLTTFGVSDPITNLEAKVYDGAGQGVAPGSPVLLPLESSETIPEVARRVGAFPQSSQDRALLFRLKPGAYALHTVPAPAATGTALAEIYDADISTAAQPALVNLSARTMLRSGAVFTAGFVVDGARPQSVLIRAVGNSLRQFGISNPLALPVLRVITASGQVVASNADWREGSPGAVRLVSLQRGAFELTEATGDAALLLTLAPGAYTAEVREAGGASGEILLEVYSLP